MRIVCDFCAGRGFFQPLRPDSFLPACAFCKGVGFVTLAAVANRIDEDPQTLKKLIRWDYRGNATPHKAVALRIFHKLMELAP